ncbi:MAG TPA: flagellar motor switch protein FliN [Bacteroidetes bacterium]|nr:flagellar motor switch protein FliN [Bacteroidota bacterium]
MNSDKTANGVSPPDWFAALGQWMEKVKDELQNGLSTLIERSVKLDIESPRLYTTDEIGTVLGEGSVAVSLGFSAKEIGGWYFLFPRSLAATLSDLAMMGEGGVQFDEALHPGTLSEIWGQVMSTLEVELNTLRGGELTIDMPEASLEPSPALDMLDSAPVIRWNLDIEKLGEGSLLMITEPAFAVMFGAEAIGKAAAEVRSGEKEKQPSAVGAAPAESQAAGEKPQPSTEDKPFVRTAEFESFGEPSTLASQPPGQPRNIHILMDVSLPITIELGRTNMLIRDILELGPGSIIELNKLSGEPVDLYVNDRKFAKGEVVVIEENFGVRITELVKVAERLEALK